MFSRVWVSATLAPEKKTSTGLCQLCVVGSISSSASPNAHSVRRIILRSEFRSLVPRDLLHGVVVAGPENATIVYWIGVGTFAACVAILMVGRHIEHTLEILNWILVVVILGGLTLL